MTKSDDLPIYTDIQGLAKLNTEYKLDPESGKKHVAEQFAAIFLQMVLGSMRQASNAISSDLTASDEMNMYQDLFDKQLSLTLASESTGLVDMIKQNIDKLSNAAPASKYMPALGTAPNVHSKASTSKAPTTSATAPASPRKAETPFTSPENFIRRLWPAAQTAGKALQLNPEVLLAQAALETNWGKAIIQHPKGGSTYNLFNIKADANWKQPVAPATTVEEHDTVLVKENAKFKTYSSYFESFMDYVSTLKNNQRYAEALSQRSDPKAFVNALQDAGYATDHNYADKIWQIFNSKTFKTIVQGLGALI